MDYCEFCGTLAAKKTVYDFKRKRPIMFGEEAKKMQEYRVAFVTRYWDKGNKRESSQYTAEWGRGGRGYKLNYCPECGRKL